MAAFAATSFTDATGNLSCTAAKRWSGNPPKPCAIMAPEWPLLLQCSKCSQSEQTREGRGQLKGRIGLECPTGSLLERHRLGQRGHESGLARTQADERRIVWPSQYKEIGGT